jgi:hypothetical protein
VSSRLTIGSIFAERYLEPGNIFFTEREDGQPWIKVLDAPKINAMDSFFLLATKANIKNELSFTQSGIYLNMEIHDTNGLKASNQITFMKGVQVYWRYREAPDGGGTIHWETSSNGVDWTEVFSYPTASLGFSITQLEVNIGMSASGAPSTTVHYDNFNVVPWNQQLTAVPDSRSPSPLASRPGRTSTMNASRKITQFKIYPSLGIARVGNSAHEYFFGPEAPGPHPRDAGDFRDAAGHVKRQAARFRVYGLDAHGKVVKEITSADAQITWKVQVANTKAAWFDFDQAFDVPASKGEIDGVPGIVSNLRNADVKGEDRTALAITPPPISISGADVNVDGSDRALAFDQGEFFGAKIYLGEVRTDAEGRLIFLGGRGQSASRQDQPPAQAVTFANNPGWQDDVSDGPVDATITYDGEVHEATGAWVLVSPPNYAPGIQGIVTGYDLLFSVAAAKDSSLLPIRPSFSEHIYPILRRLTATQWVNAGFARDFGFGTGNDFESPAMIKRLNDPGEASSALRHSIFAMFRGASYPHPQPATAPAFYGDAITLNTSTTDPREWMAVLDTQYGWLEKWASGDFHADGVRPDLPWEQLDAAEQARLLDRGVLDETLGGPFHPGAEFTWPMRIALMYSEPFRIKRRSGPRPDSGTQLTSSTALAEGGPLDGSLPGDLSRWMAVPWQTDTSSCLSGYLPYVDDYLPTFWPARVPNDVLTEQQYRSLLNPEKSVDEKAKIFAYTLREKWLRGITYEKPVAFPPQTYDYKVSINEFISDWWQVGIIVEKPGPDHGSSLPRQIWVETGRSYVEPEAPPQGLLGAPTPARKTYAISQHPRFRR